MISETFDARGGLTYVDRLDFTRGNPLRAVRRMAWPTVQLHADGSTLTFTSRTGSDTLEHFYVAALAHHPFHRRFPLPATAVWFDVEGRDQILLFWTPRAGAVLRALDKLGWDAEQPEPWTPYV
ncbi:hypothetical protein MED15_01496 [Micromonospora noduli]|uniref:Uncharacterized protein n=1 Tax=Micromonospora noduli TaxID=709876 RepID=A0ABX9D7V8_9ACTN|nr:hypothetical protein [Micromonospora noduli]RAO22647.1 hypothetical protein MED15_01496 [Micromonospora noduli]